MSFLSVTPLAVTVLITLGAALAACGAAPAENHQPPPSASSARVAGPKAPSFSVSTGGESTFSLDEHSGEVVVLYFSFPG